MLEPSVPDNEDQRLATLHRLKILDTPSDERFDRITGIAIRLFDVSIAAISYIDKDRQWFKSRQGLDLTEIRRAVSFCAYTILDKDTLVVEDTLEDERFSDNPLVTKEPKVRFYAGHPLTVGDGNRIGTLCIFDRQKRRMSDEEILLLKDLATIVENELNLVTGHRQREEELTKSAERYHNIFQTAAVSIWEQDFSEVKAAIDALKIQGVKDFRKYLDEHPDFVQQTVQSIKVLDVNDETLKMYGAKQKEDLKGSLEKVLTPESLNVFREELIAIAEGKHFFEAENVNQTLQGKRIDILMTMAIPSETSKFKNIPICMMDITEHMQAERALKESEMRFRSVAETAKDAIISADSVGRIRFWNKGAQTIFGYTEEELLGKPLTILMPERYRDAHQKGIERMTRTGVPHFIGKTVELHGMRKDGEEFPLELSLNTWNTREGRFYSGIIRDITERKKAEEILRESEKQFRHEAETRQIEKLAALGKLAAGLAHQLNNPAAAARRATSQLGERMKKLYKMGMRVREQNLTKDQWKYIANLQNKLWEHAMAEPLRLDPIKQSEIEETIAEWLEGHDIPNGWELAPSLVWGGVDKRDLDVIARNLPTQSRRYALTWISESLTVSELLLVMDRSTMSISELIDAVKAYSYMDQEQMQDVDVHEGLENTLTILGHKLGNITLEREFDRSLPRIHVSGSEINQVWTNLIDNAIDATNGQGKIRIRTYRDDDCLVVEIADDGVGIPKIDQYRIFEPFFTTKKFGKGTGLGLDIVRRTMEERYGGEVDFKSKPGETRFWVRIPFTYSSGKASNIAE